MSESTPSIESLEQQIAMLQAQLAQVQKLTAIGELMSTTTHEFNNVLMTIINYAQLGLRHKDEPTRDKALEKILAAGQRAAKITNLVLGVARNRSTSFEPTDLERLVTESLVLLEREMMKYRIRVETQFAPSPPVWVVGNQIQQVLLNLMINARQAMKGGGTLVLRIAPDDEQGMVDMTVRDTGCGIAASDLPRIFDPFFTTKSGPDESGRGGTGLGLAACRGIIESHRGRIRVESTLGRGTAFTIKLPMAKAKPPVVESEPMVSGTKTLGPEAPRSKASGAGALGSEAIGANAPGSEAAAPKTAKSKIAASKLAASEPVAANSTAPTPVASPSVANSAHPNGC